MTADATTREPSATDRDHHPNNGLVTIMIGLKRVELRPGRYPVSEIKRLGGIPQADILAQIVEGKPVPLPPEGHVEVKAGEKFIGYPPDSGSSN